MLLQYLSVNAILFFFFVFYKLWSLWWNDLKTETVVFMVYWASRVKDQSTLLNRCPFVCVYCIDMGLPCTTLQKDFLSPNQSDRYLNDQFVWVSFVVSCNIKFYVRPLSIYSELSRFESQETGQVSLNYTFTRNCNLTCYKHGRKSK